MNYCVKYVTAETMCRSITIFCTLLRTTIVSLRNHDGDAEENVNGKLNLYFTYESRATVRSFAAFITVETIAKLNPETQR